MRCVFQGFFLCSLVGIFRNVPYERTSHHGIKRVFYWVNYNWMQSFSIQTIPKSLNNRELTNNPIFFEQCTVRHSLEKLRNRDDYASVGLKDDTSEYLAAHEQPHISLRSRVLALYCLGLSSVSLIQFVPELLPHLLYKSSLGTSSCDRWEEFLKL